MKKLIAVVILLSAINSFADLKVIGVESSGEHKDSVMNAYEEALKKCENEAVKNNAKNFKIDALESEYYINSAGSGTRMKSLCILDLQ